MLSKVYLDLPIVEDMPGRRVQVLWGVKGTELQMELSPDNLEYIRVAIMNSPPVEVKPKGEKRPKCSPKKKRPRKRRQISGELAEPAGDAQAPAPAAPPPPAVEEEPLNEGSDEAES